MSSTFKEGADVGVGVGGVVLVGRVEVEEDADWAAALAAAIRAMRASARAARRNFRA